MEIRRQLAKQKTNIARQIPGRHGENMHHGQGATGGGGGIYLMNPRSKMKVGTCLGQSAIATTACCSERSRRRPGDSVTAAREPISVERGSGAPDGAQKPSINQRTTQMEGLALNQPAVAKMASHAIFQYNILVIDIDNTTLGLI